MKFRKFTCNGLNYEVAQPVEDLEIASTRPSLSESRHPTVNRISKLAEDHGIIKPLKTSLSEGRHFSFSRRTKSVEDPIPKVPKTNAPESLHSTLIRKFQGFLHSLHDHGNPTFDFVRDFVLGMALCHGVIVSHPSIPDKPISKSNISFQSSSPDEVAIIRAAKDMGYIFTKRSSTNVHIRIHDTISADLTEMDGFETMFELLASIAFTSQRKRMSTVYRYPDGKIRLICKGADSILFIRLRVPQTDQEKSVLDTTKQHVDSFAMEGLRTLVYGYRDLSEDEYENWAARYHKASTALKDRQAAMDAVAEEIEKELILLGASAVEDQLQDGVPETLENLRRAQIKLWVLTGDKRETAVNVGYASRLLRTKSKLWVVDWETLGGDGVRKFLSLKYEELSGKKTVRNSSRENVERVGTLEQDHNVLIVDGDTLTKMEQADRMAASNSDALGQKYKPILHLLFQLGSLCDSVICCRVSPMQKALVVRCVKNEIAKGKVTLAIGDGANDIAMLREANVGVGISGREGLQAVRASDYSIARFRFLSRLLLVHGHWSYVRVSKFMFGSFYKCMTFYLTQLLFQNFTGVSGTSLYESWTLAGYNLAFSALPVIFVGVFEKDLNEETLLAQPWIYAYGQINGATGLWTIFHWLLSAIYHAFCLLFLPLSFYGIYGSYDISQTNEDSSLYRLGTIVYTAVVFVVNIKISLTESHNVAWPTALITAITIAFWFVYQGVYSIMWPRGNLGYVNYGMFASLQSSASFLFIVILTVTICMLPDIVFRVFQRTFLPTQINYWQEKQKLSRRHLETPPDQSLFSMDRKPGQNNSVP
jgi:phospholipid-translocating P-type ATPase (flippase)